MKKIEKYTGKKTYMYPNGAIATPEIVKRDYPAVEVFTHIIETDEAGEVMFAIQNLSAMRNMYSIDSALSEEEAIAAIEEIINTPQEVDDTPSAEERIAAALEYQVVASLPDDTESTDTASE